MTHVTCVSGLRCPTSRRVYCENCTKTVRQPIFGGCCLYSFTSSSASFSSCMYRNACNSQDNRHQPPTSTTQTSQQSLPSRKMVIKVKTVYVFTTTGTYAAQIWTVLHNRIHGQHNMPNLTTNSRYITAYNITARLQDTMCEICHLFNFVVLK